MMRPMYMFSFLLVILAAACLDRIHFAIEKTVNQGISITGFISDQPGPYEIRIYRFFDIESIESRKTPITVKNIELSDNQGAREILNEVNEGVYQTSPSGIRGVIGGIYKLKVELFDGRVYESFPDTILATGSLDSLYTQFTERHNDVGAKVYGFDVLFDASYEPGIRSRFIWKFTGTFEAETHAENGRGGCYWLDEIGKCNFSPACSGYRNIGTNRFPAIIKKYPCTCCICWYNLYDDHLILSDDLFARKGVLNGVRAVSVPLNSWTLEYKIRLDMSQMSLSGNSFKFWKSVRDQKAAIGNLFQPVTGIIPSNFTQISGNPIPIGGLFFATSMSSKTRYLTRSDLPPDLFYAIPREKPYVSGDCRDAFPNSTNIKPAFWTD